MASLRLLCSPSTSFFPTEQNVPLTPLSSLQNPHYFPKTSQSHLSVSCSLSSVFSLSRTLPLRTKRDANFASHFSTTAQEQALESPPVEVSNETEEFSNVRLYAQNVPWSCTPEDIRSLFEKYGTVVDVELSMYNKTRNRGLAFVTMGSPEEALDALNNLQSYELEGRIIKIDYARPKKKKLPPPPKPAVTFNLFVANLHYEARAKDLREFFNSEGHEVVSSQVIFHENPRRSLGYGFVAFKSKKEADAALSACQGKMCMGRPIRVAQGRQFVKLASEESKKSGDTATEESKQSSDTATEESEQSGDTATESKAELIQGEVEDND
ncbi:hypothetical protein UlMin_035127 [Ulmus minor]